MSAEAWPTEAIATAAVEAAARKTYEDGIAEQAKVYPAGVEFTSWDGLGPVGKLQVRQAILPHVWAALQALPDPRREAWAEGFMYGQGHADHPTAYLENPYPSRLE
jgi:hypothetical protein